VPDAAQALARGAGARCAALLVLLSCHVEAGAGELAFGAGYTFTYETNPTRAVTNPVSDVRHEVLAGFAYQETTSSVKARALAQAEARRYRRDTFPDDTFLYFDGAAVWSMVPRTLDWTVEDNLGETRIDLSIPDTPNNRIQSNTFTTGPDLTLRLGSATNLILGGRYGKYDLEDAGGNERFTGSARLQHLLTGASKLTLNYEHTLLQVEPPTAVAEARREDLYLRFESRSSTANEVALDLGATRIAPEGHEEATHPRAQLSFARQLTTATGIRGSVSDYVSDAYTDSLTRQIVFLAPPPGNDVYRAQAVALSIASVSGALSFNLQGYGRKIDYELIDGDYDEAIGRLDMAWQSSPDLRLGANAEYIKRTFASSGTADIEKTATLGFTYLLTRALSIAVDAGYQEVENTGAPGIITASRLRAIVGYSTLPLYTPRSRR
jgi:hypothetical protein